MKKILFSLAFIAATLTSCLTDKPALNYEGKDAVNYTIGIKIMWTLNSDKNWVATHRFAGKVWFVGGVIVAISALLPTGILPWVAFAVFAITALAPVIYSFVYFKNHQSDADYLEKREDNE